MRFLTSMGFSSTSNPATVAVPADGRQEAREDAHGGGLPGAVWPEKAHDLPLFDLERDIVYSDSAGVSLGETFDFDHIVYVPDKTDVVVAISASYRRGEGAP